MINIQDTIRQMTANAEAMRALTLTVSEAQAQWKPAPETWSLREATTHLYHEERGDFRAHLQELLSDPPKSWGSLRLGPHAPVESCRQALDLFLAERQASLAWLGTLASPDWEVKTEIHFGPAHEAMTLSAGDVLVSWVAHDYLHIRQINELLYAWQMKQASPYSLEYAGGW
jgi:hypothetical protein